MKKGIFIVALLMMASILLFLYTDYRKSQNTELCSKKKENKEYLLGIKRGINIGNSLDACDWSYFGTAVDSGFQAVIVYNTEPWTAWDASDYVYFDKNGNATVSWNLAELNAKDDSEVGNFAIQLVNHNPEYDDTEVTCKIKSAEIEYSNGKVESLLQGESTGNKLTVKNEVTDFIYLELGERGLKTSDIMGAKVTVSLEISDYHIDTGEQISKLEQLWGNPQINKGLISEISKEGFDTVRLPVTYFNHLSDDGTIDREFLNRVEEVVDWILDEDLYCIIDLQHDTGNDGWIKASDDNYDKNKVIVYYIFYQIAEKFKDKNDHLILEGLNETVNDQNQWGDIPLDDLEVMNDWNQLFVDAVRSTGGNNAERYLLVNTYAALPTEECLRAFKMPEDTAEGKIFVGIHCYFNKNNMRENFRTIKKYSDRYNFLIGEYAFSNGIEERKGLLEDFLNSTDELKIGALWWDDGNTSNFGIIDRKTSKWIYTDILSLITGK